MRVKSVVLMLGLLIAIALPLWAQPMPDPPRGFSGCGPMMESCKPMLDELKLTPEQKKTFEEMALKHQKEMLPLRSALQAKRLDLRGEFMADNPNQSKINPIVDDIAKARAEIQKKQIAHRLEMRSVLTPEQKALWDENKGEWIHGWLNDDDAPRGHRPFMGRGAPRHRDFAPPMHDGMDE
jgi:Spy/CpxP family protein refolding chaperone